MNYSGVSTWVTPPLLWGEHLAGCSQVWQSTSTPMPDSNTGRSLFIPTEGSQTEWLSVLWDDITAGNWTPNAHRWKNTGRFDLSLFAMHTLPYKKANFHPKLHKFQHWNPFPSAKIHFYFITAKNKTHYHWRIWSYIQNAFCLCSSYSSHFRNSALKFLPHTFEIIAAMNIIPSGIITADRMRRKKKKNKNQSKKPKPNTFQHN